MKVLLSWLREFAPIEGDPEYLAEQLSDLGLAVEELRVLGGGLDGIVVARVLDLRVHPQADKIQLVDVDAGDGHSLQICCGAFNMAAGDLVPLATLGTVMPNGLEIARRKLRGEWSNGMLCSSREIELSDEHDGIMILDASLVPGTALREALGIERDVLFDLDVTGNRPDAMSVAGVARDLAARLGVPFAIPAPTVTATGADASGRVRVEVVDRDLCGRFLVRVIDNVHIGPSPDWMQHRLRSVGQRPINNVVDVSNYVMFELGQPNHTFDLAKVDGATLRVRRAREGETLVTLDGNERRLLSTDGVICDIADSPVSLAGVMGGLSTEIDASTRTVLLEIAWWDPLTIAATAKRLGLRSEASTRFERGCDPEIAEVAALRFAELLAQTGAQLASGVVDVRGNTPPRPPVRVRTARVNAILGTALDQPAIAKALMPIGFGVVAVAGDQDVTVPSYRLDTSTEIEVIEEIARHVGFATIGKTVPRSPITGALSLRQLDRRAVRRTLTGLGIDEVLPLPFLAPGDLDRARCEGRAIELTNPLVAEESVLRTSLRVGLLKTLAYNASHRNTGLRIFEVGHVYAHPLDATDRLPSEREVLAVALAGHEAPAAVAVWAALVDAFAISEHLLVASQVRGLHPSRTAVIDVLGHNIGVVGEIDPAVCAAFAVAERVAWLELDLDALLALPHGERPYARFSRFPSSDVDLAFVVDDACPAADVEREIRKAGGDLLVALSLFDVYRGEGVATGARSLAYALRFQAGDRTLTESEIAEARARCIAAVEAGRPAKLRA